jgi:hypothetical protein
MEWKVWTEAPYNLGVNVKNKLLEGKEMKNRSRKILFSLMLAGSVALFATGCDSLKKQPETETET